MEVGIILLFMLFSRVLLTHLVNAVTSALLITLQPSWTSLSLLVSKRFTLPGQLPTACPTACWVVKCIVGVDVFSQRSEQQGCGMSPRVGRRMWQDALFSSLRIRLSQLQDAGLVRCEGMSGKNGLVCQTPHKISEWRWHVYNWAHLTYWIMRKQVFQGK